MPGLIPQGTLSEIQLKVDIIELISQYVPLKGSGRSYKALCPFHSEKTPSFMVNPDKQIFHCFGCGVGGNVFSFIMRYENIPFPEAVEMLAAKAGVVISKTGVSPSEFQKKELFEATEKVAQYFEKIFLSEVQAKEARDYLRSRGVKKKAVEVFRIGFCPSSDVEVLVELKRLGMEKEILEKIGLFTEDRHLRFKGRIIFPIFDVQGRIVGFGGRALGDRLPKYLNSPDTLLFNKSHLLYGLNLAKKSILQNSQAILVEGYLDVISVFCAGLENVVASLGTAFNESHVRLLQRYAQEVIIAYDGDDAGIGASLRAMEVFLEQDMIVKVAKIPQGHDPDSWVRQEGREALQALFHRAPSMIDFKLEILLGRFKGRDEKSKLLILREMLPTIGRLKNSILRDHYIRVLSERLRVSENAIRTELKGLEKWKGFQKNPPVDLKGSHPLEEDILRILFSRKELISVAREKLHLDDFMTPEFNYLYERMLEGKSELDTSEDPQYQSLWSKLLIEGSAFKDPELKLSKFITALKIRNCERKWGDLTHQLKEIEKSGKDSRQRNVVLSELQNLRKEIDFLRRL